MSKEIYISSTPHETRLAIVENDALTEIYYERENEYTLAGSIYNGKVTRVLPGMQSSFVDIGLERDAFLYITDFMEEAGDSADFDSADGNRSEARRSRDTERAALPAPEASAEGSEESAPRNGNGNGNDRGDRSRGRGRRGRSGNRDRQPGSPQPSADAPLVDAPQADFSRHPASESEAPTDGSDLGEGAPGADGSRRWRGRRGRRRGRGQGHPEAGQQPSNGTPAEAAPAGFESDEFGEENSFEIDGAAAPAPPRSNTAPIASAYPEPIEHDAAPPQEGNRDRGSRDRGGKDRNDRGGRDRNDHNDRSARGGRDARAPRGFAPRTDLYGVDAAPAYGEPAQSDAPAGEPIILPGESLSKYRPGFAESTPSSTAAPVAAAPDFVVSGWDGSAVLPGETIRPRTPRAEQQREPRRDREPRAEHRQDNRSNFRNQQVAPVVAAIVPEIAAEPTEYEPTEAAVSYRVDPVAPSEFRQSAPPVVEEETIEEEFVEAEAEPEVEAQPHTHHATSPILEDHHTAETPELPAHDVTTVSAAGEMHSAPVTIEPIAVPAPQEVAEPAAPIAHEHSILSMSDLAADTINTGGLSYVQPIASPINGLLEEETIEDEDFRVTLHASAIEELDDLDEEESLEGAADLGTMIREMSIDQITHPGEDEEEDDLEEEDSQFDAFDETEEESDEDEEDDLEESGSDVESEDDEQAEDDLLRDAAIPQPNGEAHVEGAAPARDSGSRDRGRSRRSGRRDGRDRDRGRSRDDRPRNTGGGGDRERSGGGRRDGRSSRHSMQSTNLPAISDLLKPGQEVLVQIAKEPIAKKGARITSHIALPGRFLVFMPTVNHTGVSRKIESDGERRRLKEILLSEKGDASGGFIVRTAASGASEEELRSDLRFLLNLWADIKSRSESSKSPALIYHDLNLVERILRDQVTDNFSAIWVDTEADYERILRFLQRFQPSLIRRVKLYTKDTPLFEQFGITEEINKALRSKVWLKSGGSIVINQTEALVAIDINTGKFVGKTARLEDTIVKTNLDAIPEIVRQIRLRDLGGIIIIDFIDMDERKNRNKVMQALEDELKSDRAPSKILQFNDFGLVAITRKRVKQSLERTLSTTCGVCQGTGMVKSPITVCNDIYIEMRKMHKHLDRGDVMLRVHPEVVKQLKSSTKWLQEMEEMVGKTILVKSDPALHPEQFDIH